MIQTRVTRPSIRAARPEDATACADILWDWMQARDWMPVLYTQDGVRDFYREFVFCTRQVWAVGDPLTAFMAMDTDKGQVTALYVATPGQGLGKALLDHAKAGRDALDLWTFQANEGARRFYAREGFREVRFTEGDNEEGLPDVLLRWDRP